MSDIVQKLWGFCHVLRHDGVDYGDYIEQITYLLFIKMADERGVELPKGCAWPQLAATSGVELTDHYADALRTLGKQTGILGDIFAGSMPRFNNPVNLKRLISLIDETEWTSLDKDVKAEAFEGLLEKAASEGKKGAGQFFTPRPLIQSICRVMKPDPRVRADFTIADPAVGTAGFLVCAYEWLLEQTKGVLDRDVAKRIRNKTYYGQELVPRPRRLALMNLFLHGIEPTIVLGDTILEGRVDQRFDCILTNPPFGTKGANQSPDREDFTVETSNKQLNFVQHVLTVLKPGGRAAVVLPDNCLFADQAGEVFEILTKDCTLHTVLRLPRGTFIARAKWLAPIRVGRAQSRIENQMIRKIVLENYMAHIRTVIEPAQGLTVLIGPNNCGKSAIIHAMEMICYNSDAADYAIRHGAKKAVVTIETQDEDGSIHIISWWRTAKSAGYIIDGREISGMGKGKIPDDLHQHLRMPMIESGAGGKEFLLHFGLQKSPIFLLDDPASRAAQFFASATDADKLMQMQKAHQQKAINAKRDKEKLDGELEQLDRQLEALSPLPILSKGLNDLEDGGGAPDQAKAIL